MKYLLTRWGALGDIVFISPVIRYLKAQGHKVIVSTTERGKMLLADDPNIDDIVFTPDGQIEDVRTYWEAEAKRIGADKVVNFSESIEVALLKHPLDPKYNLPKEARIKECDVNAFDQEFRCAGINPDELTAEQKRPKLYYTQREINNVERFFDSYSGLGWNIEPKKKMIIMWVLSGSGIQKTWPYVMGTMLQLLEKYDNLYFLTVGDEVCKLLEPDLCAHPDASRIIPQSGEWSVRETMLAVKYCQMVIGPETGVFVSSGQFDTPKIGMFSSITKNHVTKYFVNDYSLEAEGVNCSPCFRMIYDTFQCPMHLSGATICMGDGFSRARIINQIENIIDKHYGGFKCNIRKLSTLASPGLAL